MSNEQDGSTVAGYRQLSYGEVGKMDQFKELSGKFIALLREQINDEMIPGTPCDWESGEWLRMAEFTMKQACMFACRAVAKPSCDF